MARFAVGLFVVGLLLAVLPFRVAVVFAAVLVLGALLVAPEVLG